MCLSRLGQIVYGCLAIVSVGLALASMFTPGWRQFKIKANESLQEAEFRLEVPKNLNMGLFPFLCQMPNNLTRTSNNNPNTSMEYCEKWFQARPAYEKVVIGAMVAGLLAAGMSFVWNLVTFCACCCKGTVFRPLPALAGLAGMCLATAVLLYGYNNQQFIEKINKIEELKHVDNHNAVSYSFYMACGATAASFANLVVGSLIVCLADKCL